MDLRLIFFTGLTIGGLSCLAVQGGLLASVLTTQQKQSGKRNYQAVLATVAFLLAKVLAYALLGFLLGSFGEVINIGDRVQVFMQLAAGIYMVLVALHLLDMHPIFRYVVLKPPKSLAKLVRNQSKSKDIFAPALLGAMTVLIPCGTTLAMEVMAISTADPWQGMAIMTAFTLGTVPLFLGIGVITSVLGRALQGKFFKLTAIAVLYLGLSSINGALVVLGSPFSAQAIARTLSPNKPIPPLVEAFEAETNNQAVEIVVSADGYSPDYVRVKRGTPVTLKLVGVNAYSCASAFRIPSLGISKNLQPNETQTITFTPQETGQIPFSCSMGMHSGIIEVI